MRVLVTGGSGYIGRELCTHLVSAGHQVLALVRRPDTELPAAVQPAVGDVTRAETLPPALAGVDAVAHLVAILDGSDAEFEAVNAQGARNVAEAARAAGVERFLHMSALGVSEANAGRTRYWTSKLAGKRAVMDSGLRFTVFEPSFVFGRGGGALATFERLLRTPVVAVIGDGRYRHQPVWVGDVAQAFAAALADPATTAGKVYPLGGPQSFSFDELLDELARVTGRPRRRKLHVPARLMRAQSHLLRHLPPPLKVTPEQIEMLLEGTECDLGRMRRDLRIEPASLTEAYAR